VFALKRYGGAGGSSRMLNGPGFLHAGVISGADPHVGGAVVTVESQTSA
jgi:hypothetical protein